MLLSTSPAGFDVFFTRCSGEFVKPGGPDVARVFGIAAAHGIPFVEVKRRRPNEAEAARPPAEVTAKQKRGG